MSSSQRQVCARGVAWREREILDLLSIWGEEKIQTALRSSHRNFDCFEKVAEQMARLGHHRTALECRSKTKTMRLEYKRVVAHNAKSGNAPITCPYYRDLDSILRGDASVKPRRVARSLILGIVQDLPNQPLELRPGSEELFSHNILSEDEGQMLASTPIAAESSAQGRAMATISEEDLDATVSGLLDDVEIDTSEVGNEDSVEKENEPPVPVREQDAAPFTTAEQSPGTRLANIRSRKRVPVGVIRVGDQMLSQSIREHSENIEEKRKMHADAKKWHEEEGRWHERFLEVARHEQMLFGEAWAKNIEMIGSAVNVMRSLGETMQRLERQRGQSPNDAGTASVSMTEEGPPNRKRSCVGKPRDRLTM